MTNLHDVFEDYLKKSGQLEPAVLGKSVKARVSVEQTGLFLDAIDKHSKYNNTLILSAMAMYVVLFVVGVILVFYYIDSPKTIAFIFGGNFLTLLTVIQELKKLWRDKNVIDILKVTLPNLSPEDVSKTIQSLYYEERTQKKAKRARE